jgi:hypothetical protein
MAITKITAPSSIPATVADYQAQNSHLMAFISQINSQAFILSDPNGTVEPTIKQGAYISHGGSLYIVDTADATISGTPSDGTVYIRVSGTDTLTAEYVTDISSYAWNSAYNAMISGSYTLLPYMLVKSGTSYTKYRFEQHKQSLGTFKSLNVADNITLGGTVDGHDIDSELDTLNGRVNQGVKTTDSPTFANSTIGGHNIDSELDTLNSRVNQDLKTTASPTFASVNTGHGANELYPMNQDVSTTAKPTFTGLILSTSTEGSYSIGAGSSWVIPAGIYVVESIALVGYEFYLSGSWVPVTTDQAKKTIFSDGTNFRLHNTDSSSKTVRYRKFS